ncbi:2'-5' RNA ligase family protein [Halorubellus salinus]|uniref:2'-5' RNA ligase family protein n=1 Tax=Halorubellus salinus TaxID=755309 RepID=UPI001D0878E2|nr:2'-5' RNA ligase family protein [Halorubellus salinus]
MSDMHSAVISTLPDEHHQRVLDVWDDLADEFDLNPAGELPPPHISYHVAERYDPATVESRLHSVAADTEPFTVYTGGVGVFTAAPVVYLPLARSPALASLHDSLWNRLTEFAEHADSYYHPDRWFPHVTLAYYSLERDQLGDVVEYLGEREFAWEMDINDVAHLEATEDEMHIRSRVEF